jgi:hypothetical protein
MQGIVLFESLWGSLPAVATPATCSGAAYQSF